MVSPPSTYTRRITMILFCRKLKEKAGSFYISLPSKMCRSLGWKNGMYLMIYRDSQKKVCVCSEDCIDSKALFHNKIDFPLKGKGCADSVSKISERLASALSGANI
jgi:hypothetical protein